MKHNKYLQEIVNRIDSKIGRIDSKLDQLIFATRGHSNSNSK